jgi:penicillin-binding protein-related factor A (putative recombinase)
MKNNDRTEKFDTIRDKRIVEWAMTSERRESKATTSLISYCKQHYGWELYKLPDIWDVKKPLDILWYDNKWTHICIEVKTINTQKIDYMSIYKKLEMHQLAYLHNASLAGCIALLVGRHPYTHKFYFYRYKQYAKT